MFTVEQIEKAHIKVKTGADFPKYIQAIKEMGVLAFETWVIDSRTVYFGCNDYQAASLPQYENLSINDRVNIEEFVRYLQIHQEGQTDYFTFCQHCADVGVEKWYVSLDEMTCTYFDRNGIVVLKELIPG